MNEGMKSRYPYTEKKRSQDIQFFRRSTMDKFNFLICIIFHHLVSNFCKKQVEFFRYYNWEPILILNYDCTHTTKSQKQKKIKNVF